jgi:hypothetical protein
LPKTPTKRAEIVKSLIRSPSTSKILCKEGVIVSPECKKKLEVAEQVISSLKENIEEVKQPNSSKSEKKHAYNILRATIQKKTKVGHMFENYSVLHTDLNSLLAEYGGKNMQEKGERIQSMTILNCW